MAAVADVQMELVADAQRRALHKALVQVADHIVETDGEDWAPFLADHMGHQSK
jgi:hypothetical protein